MDQRLYTWEFFSKSLTPGLRQKFEAVMARGLTLCLVGGASRQWILSQTLPFDLDFEIRSGGKELPTANLAEGVSQILLDVFGDIRPMPFHVFIVEQKDFGNIFQLEFSLPRKEKYQDQVPMDGFGHSDFEVQIDPGLTYAQSFMRRDFTINAIGLEFKLGASGVELSVQDPYHGLEDLAALILRPVGDAFYHDPVRFLRMIRFQISLGFSLAPSLEQNMKRFNLQKITIHYFLKEAFKAGFFDFLKCFFKYVDACQLEIPKILKILKSLSLLEKTTSLRPRNSFDLAIAIAEATESERQEIWKQSGNLLEENLGLKSKTIQKLILAKKSDEIIAKLQKLDSSLDHKFSDSDFFHHPLIRDLALVLKAYQRYPDIFESRWFYLNKTGPELLVIKKLSQCMSAMALPDNCTDEGADKDLRKMMLAMRSVSIYPRIAGL